MDHFTNVCTYVDTENHQGKIKTIFFDYNRTKAYFEQIFGKKKKVKDHSGKMKDRKKIASIYNIGKGVLLKCGVFQLLNARKG